MASMSAECTSGGLTSRLQDGRRHRRSSNGVWSVIAALRAIALDEDFWIAAHFTRIGSQEATGVDAPRQVSPLIGLNRANCHIGELRATREVRHRQRPSFPGLSELTSNIHDVHVLAKRVPAGSACAGRRTDAREQRLTTGRHHHGRLEDGCGD
jgi:hypothetical protein